MATISAASPVAGDVMGDLQTCLPGAADQFLERRFKPGQPGILWLRGGVLLQDIDPRPDALGQGEGGGPGHSEHR